jgi:acetyl-CoA carboxylase carboxyltransferase component
MNPTAPTRQRLITQLLQQLEDRKAAVARMGGDEQVRKQHARGKLTVRERVERFFDPGTFVEIGGLVRSQHVDFGMRVRDTPADGVVTGHGRVAGQCDLIAPDDEAALLLGRQLLSFLPQHCDEQPPLVPTDDPADRREEGLLEILPDSSRLTYDMHEVIDLIVDQGSFLELKDQFAPNIITGLCRLGGRTVGLIANNPDEMGGVMESDCSDKYMRLMTFCDAFNIPIVTLVDTPGYVVGREWEDKGILRHGAKLLYGYACATVPKVSVILRRSYGGGNVVMGSKTLGADFSFAWPTAEISIMGPESAAAVIWADDLRQAKTSEAHAATLDERCGEYRERFINIFSLAENHRFDFVDDIIDPRDTRRVLIRALEALQHKRVELPRRKHGNPPQ